MTAAPDLPTAPAATGPRRQFGWGGTRAWLLFVIATLLAGVFALQLFWSIGAERAAREWPRLLELQLLFWYLWLALTPLVFAIASHSRIDAKPIAQRLVAWTALAVAFAALHTLLYLVGWIVLERLRAQPVEMNFGGAWWWHFQRTIAQDCLAFALIAAAYQVVESYRRERDRERVEADLSMRLATAELGLLRMQLQPHFLFNTLNAVSSLMETDREGARTLLADLGHLFRLSLDRLGQREVKLIEEIDFVQRYLDVQRLRFGQRLRVEVTIQEDVEDAWVPSLILQPLVENAMRHGVESRPGEVTVRIGAALEGDQVRMVVEDRGSQQRVERTPAGAGIGLPNTLRRLRQMYGSEARMTAVGDGLSYTATIALPFRSRPT